MIEAILLEIKRWADYYKWTFICHQETTSMISYKKDFNYSKTSVRVNIYYTKASRWDNFGLTISTSMDHPKKGKTQMFRKNVGNKLLINLLKNPRFHSKRGYQRK